MLFGRWQALAACGAAMIVQVFGSPPVARAFPFSSCSEAEAAGAVPIFAGQPGSVIPGYTRFMKTAISVPDDTFARVSRTSNELGMSRSEFFSRAAQRYLDELDAQSLTGQIDDAVARLSSAEDSAASAVAAGHSLLDDMDDEW